MGVNMAIKTVNAAQLKNWLDNKEAVLVDVREPAEHKAAQICGASLVPLGGVCKAQLPNLKGKKLVIHCQKGGRGGTACQKLLAEDPSLDIYNLEGGLEAWNAVGLPVSCNKKLILPLERQVQLTVGLAVLTASLLGFFVSPNYFLLSAFFGAGLTFAGLTGFCGLARVLAKMPWNN
jgi:rhodanese-related sulfurtransferase